MSDHGDWVMAAARAVEAEFPSMSYIDVHRVVEIAVRVYDAERREAIALDIEADADALRDSNPGSDFMAFAATWLRNGAVVVREGRQLDDEH
jgi:hypothetical protein